jgi:hypothetical protein
MPLSYSRYCRGIRQRESARLVGRGAEIMPANSFPEWLPEVAADAVVVDPGNIAAEAQGNQWSFSALMPNQDAESSYGPREARQEVASLLKVKKNPTAAFRQCIEKVYAPAQRLQQRSL